MSIPAPIIPPLSVITTIEKDFAWLKTHLIAIIVSLIVIAGFTLGTVFLIEHFIEKHDERLAAAQQKAEGVNTATQTALMNQLAQDKQDAAMRDAQQAILIQSLIKQMSEQHAETAKQISVDATLDAQSAAIRLAQQTKATAADVTAVNDTISMSLPVSRVVVADLDLLPQAQNDVINLQGQLTAQTTITTDTKNQLADSQKVIAENQTVLISTIKADNAACQVKIDAQAAKDRKRGIWAAVGSFIVGAIAGVRF